VSITYFLYVFSFGFVGPNYLTEHTWRVFNRYCTPNSPAIPTDSTQNPEWEDVSWTPLVDIPGMPTGEAPLGGYIVALYNFLLGAIGIIAMMMLVYGGFRYMTSAGNPTAMGDAKDIFYSAIIGLALALISYLIISAINPELLFTQDAKLVPAGSPGYSTNLPANSCSYNLSGFEPDNCRCIGDDAEEGGDTTCEVSKSEHNWTGTCDDLCKNEVCVSNPKCCIKVDLRVGTSSTDVTSKRVEINAGGFVFFDALSHSHSCKYPITAVSIDAKSNWWAPFQDVPEYEERIGDYPCRCGIGTKGKCNDYDEWCKAKPGRFVYKFDDADTYYPKLRIGIGADEGGHLCTDITESEKTHDEAVTVIVK
jgi:hypothetical protein